MATLATLGCSLVLRFRKPEAVISSSAEIIARNQDLLTEILIRIPPKQCHSLISSLQFSHYHYLHCQNRGFLTPTALFLRIRNYYRPPFELPALPLNPETRVPSWISLSTHASKSSSLAMVCFWVISITISTKA
ncbi:hypothetical protein V6N13_043408 [Hibiscus sabdariffa]|uniref:Uncharacterized protein n=1 Tax=Hibiscus sabdariffa TaxID=183260 RepID=A0ABR2G2S0_9ROSI